MKKTLLGAAVALALAACGKTAPATAPAPTKPPTATTPDGMTLRHELGCDHVLTAEQVNDSLPVSSQTVKDSWGCVWDDRSKGALIAVRLASDSAAKEYFSDAVQDKAKKPEVDGPWVFLGTTGMARYLAHEAYQKASK